MAKTSTKKVFLYLTVFILHTASILALIVIIPLFIASYTEGVPELIYVLTAFIIDMLVLFACRPVWNEMVDRTTDDPKRGGEFLLKDADTPLEVRRAINAFKMGMATLDDAINIAPYGIYSSEIYNILKKQKFPFVEREKKREFMFEMSDFLQTIRAVRSGKMTSDEAFDALFYELLTPTEVISVLRENGEDYPQTVCELSRPDFEARFDYDEVFDIFRKERKNTRVCK